MRSSILFPSIRDDTCEQGLGAVLTIDGEIRSLAQLNAIQESLDVQKLALDHGAVLLPRASIDPSVLRELEMEFASRSNMHCERQEEWRILDGAFAASALPHCHPGDELIHLLYEESSRVGLLTMSPEDAEQAFLKQPSFLEFADELCELRRYANRAQIDIVSEAMMLRESIALSGLSHPVEYLEHLDEAILNWAKVLQCDLREPISFDLSEFAGITIRSSKFHARDAREERTRKEDAFYRRTRETL